MAEQVELGENTFLSTLPKTAIQALYNAVTGKTETLSKNIDANVVITSSDIDRLYGMIIDQIDIHQKIAEPTTTIVVKNENDKAVTYSSWARYQALRVNNHDVTSDITLKVEFVTQLPNTSSPQRCVINVNLDSALPVVLAQRSEAIEIEPLGFLVVFSSKWRTAKISIDFVDFIIAKSFVNIVEEWVQSLKKTPSSRWNKFIVDHMTGFRTVLQQLGRIGMGGFLIAFALLIDEKSRNIVNITIGVGFGLLIWAGIEIFETIATRRFVRRVSSNIVPTVILLNEADDLKFGEIIKSVNNPLLTIFNVFLSIIITLILNILASYIYARISGN